jgi:hypothetical protein
MRALNILGVIYLVRRNYWMMIVGLLILLIVGASLAVVSFYTLRVSAPSATIVSKPLTLYYIDISDDSGAGNKIGCGDSVVAVKTADVITDDIVKSTFEKLLSDHDRYYDDSGLYNVLYNSNLTYVSSSRSSDAVTVDLAGTISLYGECDNPRVKAELETTAKTAADVNVANIFINSKPLSEVLSLK